MIEGKEEPDSQQILRFGVLEALRKSQTVRTTSLVGRNDPCPCGSGRKYKRCHDGKALSEAGPGSGGQPTRERAGVLKAMLLLFCDRVDPMRTARFMRILGGAGSGRSLLDIPASVMVLLDAVCPKETERFLEETRRCGALLSEMDEALLRDWATRSVSVFEVTDRLAGSFLRVRDLRSGVESEVHGPDTSRAFEPGEYLIGRIVPVGPEYHFGEGAGRVPMADRDTTLDFLQ